MLSLVYDREAAVSVRHITAEHYFLNPVSNTFHGRDIFAPVAAWLAKTYQTEAMGEEITDYARFALPRPKPAGTALKGVVLRVDVFGNLLTNLTAEDLPPAMIASGKIALDIGGKRIEKLAQTFAQGRGGRAGRDSGIERLPGDRGKQRPRRARLGSQPRGRSDA